MAGTMTAHQKETIVTFEGEIYRGAERPPWKVSISTTLVPEGSGAISQEDILKAASDLRTLISTATESEEQEVGEESGSSRTSFGPPRPLDVLQQVYTPKNIEHVADLLWEKQITQEEYETLTAAMRGKHGQKHGETAQKSSPNKILRSIESLLKEFEIRDLRDANRARFKRLISYEEWDLLKQHFSKSSL